MSEPTTFTATVSGLLMCLRALACRLLEAETQCWNAQSGELRVKGEEIVVPIVVGTVAWYLGKKVNFLVLVQRHSPVACCRNGCAPANLRTVKRNFLLSQATEYNSHRWTVYLRGANGQDLSYCIKKVLAMPMLIFDHVVQSSIASLHPAIRSGGAGRLMRPLDHDILYHALACRSSSFCIPALRRRCGPSRSSPSS